MKRIAAALGYGLLATVSCPVLAAVAPPVFAQAPVAVAPQIAVNLATLAIAIDRDALAEVRIGQTVEISIVGVGRFGYVVDSLVNDPEVLEINGHLAGNRNLTLSLGLRAEGLSGVIKTADNIYAIGYANETQYFGPISTTWMAEQLAGPVTTVETTVSGVGAKPPVKGAASVSVQVPALAAMRPGESTVMQLPGLGYARVAFDELRPGNGSTTWVGHLLDFGDSYKAVLTYSPAGIEGTILTPNGEVNITTGADGESYIFSPAELGLVNGMSAGGDCAKTELHGGPLAVVSQHGAVASGSGTAATAVAGAAATDVVDVLVYYTPGMVTAYGSAAAVATRIDSLIALANQAYTAGGLSYRIRRVGLDLLSIADDNSNSTLLSQMAARSGAFAGLDARRAEVGADLVSIVRPFYAAAQGYSCGVAYVLGSGATSLVPYSGYAVSVVSDGSDRAGSGYYCDTVSFAHELGHNMGLMHDRATVASQGGGIGATAYAFGYVPSSAKWGTIMSYTFPHTINFSNPADFTCNGSEVCGISQTAVNSADNVSALAYTMPVVGAFVPAAATTATYGVTGVVTVNGTAVAGASMAIANVTGGAATDVSCTASGSNGVYACTAPAGYGFKLTPSYTPSGGATVTWTPASATFTAIAANQTANFAGVTPKAKYTLSGTVKINGVAASGVTMRVSGLDATRVACTTTTTTGAYSCTAPAGATFTIRPYKAVTTGWTLAWTPATFSVSAIAADKTVAFAGVLTSPTKRSLTVTTTINGVKTTAVPLNLSVTGTLSSVTCQKTTALTTVCSIPSNYGVTVAPTSTGVVFTPVSKSLASMSVNAAMSFAGKR